MPRFTLLLDYFKKFVLFFPCSAILSLFWVSVYRISVRFTPDAVFAFAFVTALLQRVL